MLLIHVIDRREWEETQARLEAEAEELYRQLQAAYEEIERLRQFEGLRVAVAAERDEGSLLQ